MKKLIPILLTATALLLFSVGTSCGGTSTVTTPSPINKAALPKIDKPAPDFTVTDVSGKKVTLSDFKGKKVLISFWSITCDGCAMEDDFFEAVHNEYPDIQILMVNSKDSFGTVRQYARASNYTRPLYSDENKVMAGAYDVRFIPKTFFINSDGIIKYIQDGAFTNQTQLEDALKLL
jgi:peroxiredoxin